MMHIHPSRYLGSGVRCLLTFWAAGLSLLALASESVAGHEAASWSTIELCLQRMVQAPERTNFEGTFVVDGVSRGTSSRIVHYGDGRGQLERIERLDGPERIVYRHDDELVVWLPAERMLSIESRRFIRPFPFVGHQGADHVADHYRLVLQGLSRIAQRPADVVSLVPKDAFRYGYRLWLDRATGLPLRAEIIGPQQQVLEWAAFSSITMGVKPDPQRVLQGMKPLDGWRVLQPALSSADLSAEGWVLRGVPPGFDLIRTVKRPCPPDGGRAEQPATESTGPMLQLIFSDGLTHVSLFVEPFEAHARRHNMLVSMGATQTAMVRRDAWWLTAMGDVPVNSLKAFLSALQRRD